MCWDGCVGMDQVIIERQYVIKVGWLVGFITVFVVGFVGRRRTGIVFGRRSVIDGGVDIGERVDRGGFGFCGFSVSHVEETAACLEGRSLEFIVLVFVVMMWIGIVAKNDGCQ